MRKVIPTESKTSQKIQPQGNSKENKREESRSCPRMSDAMDTSSSSSKNFLSQLKVRGGGGQTLPGIFGRQERSTKNIPCSLSKNSIVTTTTIIKHCICLVAYILQNTSTYIIQLGFEHLCCKKKKRTLVVLGKFRHYTTN